MPVPSVVVRQPSTPVLSKRGKKKKKKKKKRKEKKERNRRWVGGKKDGHVF
jgi:hypothetical protein